MLYTHAHIECSLFKETTQHHSRDHISITANRASQGICSRPVQDIDEPIESGE